MRISPQTFPRLSCFVLKPFQHRIPWRILPVPPAPAVFDQRVIDVGPIGQEHIGNGALVLVFAVRLKRDLFPKGEVRSSLLGVVAERLPLLWTIDAVETDAFSMVTVQDLDGVAVNYPNDSSGVVRRECRRECGNEEA